MNKEKYIVTDPCYLLTYKEWSNACVHKSNEDFQGEILKTLEEKTGSKAWISNTGYGDWNNWIDGPNVLSDLFCADSGLVCVCKWTEELEKLLNQKYGSTDNLVAIFEAEGEIDVKFNDNNSFWIVVEIEDESGNKWSTSESEE